MTLAVSMKPRGSLRTALEVWFGPHTKTATPLLPKQCIPEPRVKSQPVGVMKPEPSMRAPAAAVPPNPDALKPEPTRAIGPSAMTPGPPRAMKQPPTKPSPAAAVPPQSVRSFFGAPPALGVTLRSFAATPLPAVRPALGATLRSFAATPLPAVVQRSHSVLAARWQPPEAPVATMALPPPVLQSTSKDERRVECDDEIEVESRAAGIQRPTHYDPAHFGLRRRGFRCGAVTTTQQQRWQPYEPDPTKMTPEVQQFLQQHVFVTQADIARISSFTQGSPEWLNERRFRLGGSEYAAAVGLNPYDSVAEFTRKKVHQTVKTSDAMRRGTKLEPKARDKFFKREFEVFVERLQAAIAAKETHVEYALRLFPIPSDVAERVDREIFYVAEAGSEISLKWPWLSSSSDGDIYIFGRKVGILEIKSPKLNKIYTISPPYYYPQIQGNMCMHRVGFCKFITYADDYWAPLQVDHYEYDARYCNEWLIPSLHRYYFQKLLPALMQFVEAKKGTPTERFAARFPGSLEKEKRKRGPAEKEELETKRARTVPPQRDWVQRESGGALSDFL